MAKSSNNQHYLDISLHFQLIIDVYTTFILDFSKNSYSKNTHLYNKSPIKSHPAYYRGLTQFYQKLTINDCSNLFNAAWSQEPIVSLAECMDRSGTPISIVRIGTRADAIDPSVEPPGSSE